MSAPSTTTTSQYWRWHILLFARFIYDFVKTTVLSNGTVWITVQYLDALSFNVTMSEGFVCSIATASELQGAGSGGGVAFYDLSAARPSRSDLLTL